MSKLKSWVRGGNAKGEAGYWLAFDYDPDIIESIKQTIPSQFRVWDADKKEWWVSEYCEKQIDDIFKGFLQAVIVQKRLF